MNLEQLKLDRFLKRDVDLKILEKSVKLRVDKKSDLILSPSFYWFKRANLPLKYLFQAKKYVDSVFDNTLPNGEFEYFVYKKDDGEFWFFAYEPSKIVEHIIDSGVDINLIENFHFAQIEFDGISEAVSVSEELALINLDGVISLIPSQFADDIVSFRNLLKHRKITNATVKISVDTKFNTKIIEIVSIFLILFIVTLFADIIFLKSSVRELNIREQMIYNSFNLPKTALERDAIRNKLKKIEQEQLKIREFFVKLSELKLPQNSFLERVKLEKRGVYLIINMESSEGNSQNSSVNIVAETIKKEMEKFLKLKNAKVENKKFTIEAEI